MYTGSKAVADSPSRCKRLKTSRKMLLDGQGIRYGPAFVHQQAPADTLMQVQEVEDIPEDAARWVGDKVRSTSPDKFTRSHC